MLFIFTLAYQAEPFIERHLPIFEQLTTSAGPASDWHWIIVHGPSSNGGSTKWCQPQRARLSTDGTTEFLRSIRKRSNVTVIEKKLWPSKDEMVNAALEKITEPCTLMQIDADEIWSPSQLETIVRLFAERPQLSSIMFPCRYFVGHDASAGSHLILRGENCYGDFPYEWIRAWRYTPGRRFISHEPPILEGDDPAQRMSKNESRSLGLIFDHMAYATEAQCAFKEKFYGYRGLVNQWHALQRHFTKPLSSTLNPPSSPALSRFFPHVKGPLPTVEKILLA